MPQYTWFCYLFLFALLLLFDIYGLLGEMERKHAEISLIIFVIFHLFQEWLGMAFMQLSLKFSVKGKMEIGLCVLFTILSRTCETLL